MSAQLVGRGNRSSGTVDDYLAEISQGYTLDEIGTKYGVTHGAVRKMLKANGLPTCALDYLRWLRSESQSRKHPANDSLAP